MPIFPAGSEHLTDDATGSQIAGVLNRVQDYLVANPPTAPVLSHQHVELLVDVPVDIAGTWTDLLTLTLSPGVWLVLGKLQDNPGMSSGSTHVWVQLWDGTTTYGISQEFVTVISSSDFFTIPVYGVVTLTTTTTIKMSATGATWARYRTQFGVGPAQFIGATYLDAVKIG